MDMGAMEGHEGHDHSAHAAHPAAAGAMGDKMDMSHGAVGRNPDGSYFYTHGAFTGHVVPGTFFLLWGLWWTVALFINYIRAAAARKPFASRGWWLVPGGPAALQRLPLEPIVKIVLPFFGALGELWLGHESYRRLHESNGMFMVDNLNDWQHAAMYAAFMTSGVVDLVGHYLQAPPKAEHAFLGLAFLVEGTLLVFHLKGPAIEVRVHLILVLQIFATFLAVLAEASRPGSIVLASLRPWLTMLQGVWWIQTAYIMYTGNPAWDPDYMGSAMMAPVVLVVHMLWIAAAMLLLLMVMRAVYERKTGRPVPLAPSSSPTKAGGLPLTALDEGGSSGGVLELSSLMPGKGGYTDD